MSRGLSQLKSAARRSDGVDNLARAGLVAYGIVHLLIGVLAVRLSIGDRAGSASSDGAIRELAQKPFGLVAVLAVGIGMLLLALWQGVEAASGHQGESGNKRTYKRVVAAGKALIYVAIGVSALRLVIGAGSSGGGGTTSLTAKVLSLPGGQILVAAFGVGLILAGVMLVHKAVGDRFLKDLEREGSTGADGAAYLWLGRVGYAAKGAALGAVGVLFAIAALTREANQSGGLDQALRRLLGQPFGPYLAMAIGAGFAAFGLFCFAWARHLDRSRTSSSSG